MIDEKKIEEAAHRYCKETGCAQEASLLITEVYTEGVHWAIKEFLKSLWHDASEEPKKDANCLVCISCEYEDTPEDNYREYTTSMYLGDGWSEYHFPSEADAFIIKWCYLDDLFPMKVEPKK